MKTYEQILKDFIKANKQRRAVIVADKGFATEQQYKEYITTLIKGEIEQPKVASPLVKPTIHIVQILDRSGSMGGAKLTNAVSGINSEVTELRKDDSVNYTLTLVEFDDKIKTRFTRVPIADVPRYSTQAGGTTALYQAIGETLENMIGNSNGVDKFLIKIFTDGGENASKGKYKYSSDVSKVIKQAEEIGFTITFVGTTQDVQEIQNRLKIDDSNTLIHDNTSRGVADSFRGSTIATMAYSSKVLRGQDVKTEFYSKKVGKL